jgi:preprotein translocase subunit SecA
MERLGVGEDDVIENRFVGRAIEQAQTKIEGNNFDIRKYVLEYDDVMNQHRTAIYKLRRLGLEQSDIKETILNYVLDEIDRIVSVHTVTEGGEWNIEEIYNDFRTMIPIQDDLHSKIEEIAAGKDPEKLKGFLTEVAQAVYAHREKEMGPEAMRNLERMVFLRVIDEIWVDHLEQMEYLRDSVRLRAYGQRDPLVEYKIEGQRLFNQLQAVIGSQIANLIFKVGFVNQPQPNRVTEEKIEAAPVSSGVSRQMAQEVERRGASPVHSDHPEIGRNDPCWCGSGKKYKKCHGK